VFVRLTKYKIVGLLDYWRTDCPKSVLLFELLEVLVIREGVVEIAAAGREEDDENPGTTESQFFVD
jgi:hypothetical protein